ncbi:hypothetical protein SAFG77S_08792 [Streptomyces afghaniensis]
MPNRPPSSSRSAVVSISGKSGGEALPRRGSSTVSPNRRANATCPAWSSRCPRKNTTFHRSTADLIAATTVSSRSAARSTPLISAPMCPATGFTSTPASRTASSVIGLSVVMRTPLVVGVVVPTGRS